MTATKSFVTLGPDLVGFHSYALSRTLSHSLALSHALMKTIIGGTGVCLPRRRTIFEFNRAVDQFRNKNRACGIAIIRNRTATFNADLVFPVSNL